jgi:hypothetical protein
MEPEIAFEMLRFGCSVGTRRALAWRGSVPEHSSSRRRSVLTPCSFAARECSDRDAMWDENVERSCSTSCPSPTVTPMYLKRSTLPPGSHGTKHPCATSAAARPKAFINTVLPPPFGPEKTTAVACSTPPRRPEFGTPPPASLISWWRQCHVLCIFFWSPQMGRKQRQFLLWSAKLN